MNNDIRNASASSMDDLWRRSNEARRLAEAEQSYPFDPDCRFGAVDVEHRCTDPFGAPVREGGTCFTEANAQMHDQERQRRFQERAESIERTRLARLEADVPGLTVLEFIEVDDLDKALVERLYPQQEAQP